VRSRRPNPPQRLVDSLTFVNEQQTNLDNIIEDMRDIIACFVPSNYKL